MKRILTTEDFLELEPQDRAGLVLNGAVQFVDEDGMPVELREALAELADTWAPTLTLTPVPPPPVITKLRLVGGKRASKQDTSGFERRRHERRPIVEPVQVNRAGAPVAMLGVSRDLSAGGLRFRSRGRFAVGERIEVRWAPDEPQEPARFELGTVVRSVLDEPRGQREFPCETAVVFDVAVAA